MSKLTERELDVMKLLALGHSQKEISQRLEISHSTTKAHLTNIYNKLNVDNAVSAVMACREVWPV